MTDLRTTLHERLTEAAAQGSVLSASVIARAGARPETVWLPESATEPVFLAYSITKTFVATLVLMLCDEGRLHLDDPLAGWFPGIAGADRISVRQLLNHTAGIPDYSGIPAYHESVRSSSSMPWSFERFAAETFDKALRFEPGEGWEYSNPGYTLVKRIVEEVGGASLRHFIDDRIASPLGLLHTFVAESIDDLAALAPGSSRHLSSDGTPRDVRHHYHPGWVSHGVVASTSSEIARFVDKLMSGHLVSAHSLEQMTTWVPVPVETPAHWRKPSYGLGLMGDPAYALGLVFGHNGAGPCYQASVFHAPDLGGATVCAMAAVEERFDAEAIVLGLLDQFARA